MQHSLIWKEARQPSLSWEIFDFQEADWEGLQIYERGQDTITFVSFCLYLKVIQIKPN